MKPRPPPPTTNHEVGEWGRKLGKREKWAVKGPKGEGKKRGVVKNPDLYQIWLGGIEKS